MIAQRLFQIRKKIEVALARSTAPERRVTIVAVTKGRPVAIVEEAAAAGLRDIGENRVNEAQAKSREVQAPLRWHMIGHLQRNKAAKAARIFDCVHSIDDQRLIDLLAGTGAALDLFLQVNISGETTKRGVAPEAARALWQAALRADSLRVVGLMTMAPYSEDPEAARPVFRGLFELRAELNRLGDGPPLTGLSMGMSADHLVAIEEGATHVRIGTALTGHS